MNKFYKYKVGKDEFALTEKEHQQILSLIQDKEKGLIILRDGEIVLNLSFISSIKEITLKSELEKFDIPKKYLLK